MNILDQLGIKNQTQLREEFNKQTGELVARLRKDAHDGAAQSRLAELTRSICEYMLRTRRVTLLPGQDADDVIQMVSIRVLECAPDPKYDLTAAMEYIQRMLRNRAIDMARRGKYSNVGVNMDGAEDDERPTWVEQVSSNGRQLTPSTEGIWTELAEERAESIESLMQNNGFTSDEVTQLKKLIKKVEGMKPGAGYQELLTESYLGDLLAPGFGKRMQAELGISKATLSNRLSEARELLFATVKQELPGDEAQAILTRIERIHTFREIYRPRMADSDVSASETTKKKRRPNADLPYGSTYISPTDMIRRMGHTASPELVRNLNQLLMELVSTRRDEVVTRADGTREAIGELLVPARPQGGGRYTIYINIQAEPFLEKHMGLKRHDPKTHFIPLTEFDQHIGRPAKPDTLQGTFDFLFTLWRENPVLPIGEGKQRARDFIQFVPPYNNQSPGKFLSKFELTPDEKKELSGKAIYVDPGLHDYACEHLACRSKEKHTSWARIAGREGGILERLGVYRKPTQEKKIADHLAVIELLTELKAKKMFTIGDPPEQKPTSDYMGRFLIGGSRSALEQDGIWMVDPAILGPGKPITKDMVTERARHILDHPEQHPAFIKATKGGRDIHA